MINVVSAFIVKRFHDGITRALLSQRAPRKSYPLSWCSAGGTKDKLPGGTEETDEEALRRELLEELGPKAHVKIGKILYSDTGPGTTMHDEYHLTCYVCEPVEGAEFAPVLAEGVVGVGWFPAEIINLLPMAVADRKHRADMIDALVYFEDKT